MWRIKGKGEEICSFLINPSWIFKEVKVTNVSGDEWISRCKGDKSKEQGKGQGKERNEGGVKPLCLRSLSKGNFYERVGNSKGVKKLAS